MRQVWTYFGVYLNQLIQFKIEGEDVTHFERLGARQLGYRYADMKLILRKLTDMTKEELWEVQKTMLEYSDLSFVPTEKFDYMKGHSLSFYYTERREDGEVICDACSSVDNLPLKSIFILLEKGFDIFGLIKANLAIDFTTLPEELQERLKKAA